MLPRPERVVVGASPVACAIADLAARSGYAVTVAALAEDQDAIPDAVRRIEGLALPGEAAGERFIVVATQGKRDADGLRAALATRSEEQTSELQSIKRISYAVSGLNTNQKHTRLTST